MCLRARRRACAWVERVRGKPPPSEAPKSSSFTRGPRRAAGGPGGGGAPGAGAEREPSGRGRLCRAAAAHAPRARSRARPPAPQPRARRGPAQPAPRRGASRFPPAPGPPRGGGGDWEGASGAAEEAGGEGCGMGRRREPAAAAARAGPPSRSWATCTGHPREGGESRRSAARRFCGAGPGRGPPRGRPRRTPPPSARARPNYLSPSSLRPPPPWPPPAPPGEADRARPGCESRRPSRAPGPPGCEGIFHSFLSRAQTAQCFSHSHIPAAYRVHSEPRNTSSRAGFRGCVYVCVVVRGGRGTCPKGGKISFEKQKTKTKPLQTTMVLPHC